MGYSVEDWDTLADKSPERIVAVAAALGPLIALYQENVERTLEERHRQVEQEFARERAFLAELAKEWRRMADHISSGADEALARSAAGDA